MLIPVKDCGCLISEMLLLHLELRTRRTEAELEGEASAAGDQRRVERSFCFSCEKITEHFEYFKQIMSK